MTDSRKLPDAPITPSTHAVMFEQTSLEEQKIAELASLLEVKDIAPDKRNDAKTELGNLVVTLAKKKEAAEKEFTRNSARYQIINKVFLRAKRLYKHHFTQPSPQSSTPTAARSSNSSDDEKSTSVSPTDSNPPSPKGQTAGAGIPSTAVTAILLGDTATATHTPATAMKRTTASIGAQASAGASQRTDETSPPQTPTRNLDDELAAVADDNFTDSTEGKREENAKDRDDEELSDVFGMLASGNIDAEIEEDLGDSKGDSKREPLRSPAIVAYRARTLPVFDEAEFDEYLKATLPQLAAIEKHLKDVLDDHFQKPYFRKMHVKDADHKNQISAIRNGINAIDQTHFNKKGDNGERVVTTPAYFNYKVQKEIRNNLKNIAKSLIELDFKLQSAEIKADIRAVEQIGHVVRQSRERLSSVWRDFRSKTLKAPSPGDSKRNEATPILSPEIKAAQTAEETRAQKLRTFQMHFDDYVLIKKEKNSPYTIEFKDFFEDVFIVESLSDLVDRVKIIANAITDKSNLNFQMLKITYPTFFQQETGPYAERTLNLTSTGKDVDHQEIIKAAITAFEDLQLQVSKLEENHKSYQDLLKKRAEEAAEARRREEEQELKNAAERAERQREREEAERKAIAAAKAKLKEQKEKIVALFNGLKELGFNIGLQKDKKYDIGDFSSFLKNIKIQKEKEEESKTIGGPLEYRVRNLSMLNALMVALEAADSKEEAEETDKLTRLENKIELLEHQYKNLDNAIKKEKAANNEKIEQELKDQAEVLQLYGEIAKLFNLPNEASNEEIDRARDEAIKSSTLTESKGESLSNLKKATHSVNRRLSAIKELRKLHTRGLYTPLNTEKALIRREIIIRLLDELTKAADLKENPEKQNNLRYLKLLKDLRDVLFTNERPDITLQDIKETLQINLKLIAEEQQNAKKEVERLLKHFIHLFPNESSNEDKGDSKGESKDLTRVIAADEKILNSIQEKVNLEYQVLLDDVNAIRKKQEGNSSEFKPIQKIEREHLKFIPIDKHIVVNHLYPAFNEIEINGDYIKMLSILQRHLKKASHSEDLAKRAFLEEAIGIDTARQKIVGFDEESWERSYELWGELHTLEQRVNTTLYALDARASRGDAKGEAKTQRDELVRLKQALSTHILDKLKEHKLPDNKEEYYKAALDLAMKAKSETIKHISFLLEHYKNSNQRFDITNLNQQLRGCAAVEIASDGKPNFILDEHLSEQSLSRLVRYLNVARELQLTLPKDQQKEVSFNRSLDGMISFDQKINAFKLKKHYQYSNVLKKPTTAITLQGIRRILKKAEAKDYDLKQQLLDEIFNVLIENDSDVFRNRGMFVGLYNGNPKIEELKAILLSPSMLFFGKIIEMRKLLDKKFQEHKEYEELYETNHIRALPKEYQILAVIRRTAETLIAESPPQGKSEETALRLAWELLKNSLEVLDQGSTIKHTQKDIADFAHRNKLSLQVTRTQEVFAPFTESAANRRSLHLPKVLAEILDLLEQNNNLGKTVLFHDNKTRSSEEIREQAIEILKASTSDEEKMKNLGDLLFLKHRIMSPKSPSKIRDEYLLGEKIFLAIAHIIDQEIPTFAFVHRILDPLDHGDIDVNKTKENGGALHFLRPSRSWRRHHDYLNRNKMSRIPKALGEEAKVSAESKQAVGAPVPRAAGPTAGAGLFDNPDNRVRTGLAQSPISSAGAGQTTAKEGSNDRESPKPA